MRLRSQFARAGLGLTILALLVIDLHAWSDSGFSRKDPVPEASAQAAAAKLAKEVYGDEFAAAKTPAEKRQLARKLLSKTGEIGNDVPARYVLLRLSRDIAVQAGDIETAFLAIEQIDHLFAVNALDLKREVLVKSAALASTPAEHKAVVGKCLAILDQAIANDDFQVAAQLGPLAIEESANCKDQNLARQVPLRVAAIEELARSYEKVKAATALLDKVPDDPEANLTIGSYLCFAKGRWQDGVPMLALGKDPAFKAVAIKELDGVQTAQAQLALADQWRDLAEVQPAAVKQRMRERALFWYRKSSFGLTGLMKSKAEMRIKELAPEEVASFTTPPVSGRPDEDTRTGPAETSLPEHTSWTVPYTWSEQVRKWKSVSVFSPGSGYTERQVPYTATVHHYATKTIHAKLVSYDHKTGTVVLKSIPDRENGQTEEVGSFRYAALGSDDKKYLTAVKEQLMKQ